MKKIHKILAFYLSVFILGIFILPAFVFAQPVPPGTVAPKATVIHIGIENPLKDSDGTLMSLINAVLNNIVMPIAAVAVVMYIIWAGFSYVTAQGNPKKIQEAHDRLLWALIGAGVLLGAAGISAVVKNTIDALIK